MVYRVKLQGEKEWKSLNLTIASVKRRDTPSPSALIKTSDGSLRVVILRLKSKSMARPRMWSSSLAKQMRLNLSYLTWCKAILWLTSVYEKRISGLCESPCTISAKNTYSLISHLATNSRCAEKSAWSWEKLTGSATLTPKRLLSNSAPTQKH